MRAAAILSLFLAACGLVACGADPITAGLEQPIRIRDAQFRTGDLPGLTPLSAEQTQAGVEPTFPAVRSASVSNGLLNPGAVDVSISGRTSTDAYSVGVRIEGEGSGYWVAPVSAPDPVNQGELTWNLSASFAPDLKPGAKKLLIAAFDAQGHAGTQTEADICVLPPFKDNLNACNPKKKPPELVVSLTWDSDADLDLRIVTPTGAVLDAKHPSGAAGKGAPPSGGVLEEDSGRDCSTAGIRREDAVWKEKPASGRYVVYANLFDPCGTRAVPWSATIRASAPGPLPDTFETRQVAQRSGTLLDVQANGGAKIGTFVLEFLVP
ncbi:MAG: hypothetical protein SFV15_00825 [Polyangiaceae bacterium]|nr:hypothetical protein [Polyangiaceae bacterium]